MSERAARNLGKLHLSLAGIWVLLSIPAVLLWKESVLFVIICSLYANIGFHIASWQGSRAERSAERGNTTSN